MRGKNALVQAVVKNIARKEAKEPETRSDDEVRAELRAKGEQVVKVCTSRQETPGRKRFLLYCSTHRLSRAGSLVVLSRETVGDLFELLSPSFEEYMFLCSSRRCLVKHGLSLRVYEATSKKDSVSQRHEMPP